MARFRGHLKRGRWVALLVPFLGLGGCGDGGAGPGEPPKVVLESVILEGPLLNIVEIRGHATDDKGLTSLFASLDGEIRDTVSLDGIWESFVLRVLDVPVGEHEVEIEVLDKHGYTDSERAVVTVPDPIPVYDATIYMMRHDKIEPVPGVKFCLSEFCEITDPSGKARFKDFPLRPNYELSFIEGAHPQYLAGIGESRLDKNYVNYVNGEMLSQP